MADPFKKGDDARERYLEQALHANDEALQGTKVSDLFNKDSTVYKDAEVKKPQAPAPEPLPTKPVLDADGYPMIDQVHTYKADLADVVKADKLSMSRIAMMQDTANRNVPLDTTPKKKPVNVLLIISIALFMLGLGVIGGVYMLATKNLSPSTADGTQAPTPKYIIFAEAKQPLAIENITKSQVGASIAQAAQGFKEEDSVMQIIPAEGGSAASLSSLFAKTDTRIPDDLARTLLPTYFLGLYSQKGVAYPFLLFYADSYDIAYPGLLNWEGYMRDDLNWLFNTSSLMGTTTIALSFKDRVISNTDARSYEDAQGKTAFFYMFLDSHTILFARTADTVREVQDRLRQAKFQ